MQRMFQNHYLDSMASVLAVGSKGKEMQRAVILGRQTGSNQKALSTKI